MDRIKMRKQSKLLPTAALMANLFAASSASSDACVVPIDMEVAKAAYDACIDESGASGNVRGHNLCTSDYGGACLSAGYAFLTVDRETGFTHGACLHAACNEAGTCRVSADIGRVVRCGMRGGCKEIDVERFDNCTGLMKVAEELVDTFNETDEVGFCGVDGNGEQTCNLYDSPWWWYTGIPWVR
uniref:Uncharacterized protein n=1 Tax=Trieres chinensis TaxID=1514140 RepID=A0A7S1Z3D3_TRICV|mmetsp:Transcript_16486/g.33786  ORF Transcript_16486/g.33786 Transcript_16486/m.33786 type:complete len:185 (+) Transcript_16486:212-766(+)